MIWLNVMLLGAVACYAPAVPRLPKPLAASSVISKRRANGACAPRRATCTGKPSFNSRRDRAEGAAWRTTRRQITPKSTRRAGLGGREEMARRRSDDPIGQ